MNKTERTIKNAWFDDETFEQLMAEYCPDIPMHTGPFGGRAWGDSYWNGYCKDGVTELLIARLLAKVELLKAETKP